MDCDEGFTLVLNENQYRIAYPQGAYEFDLMEKIDNGCGELETVRAVWLEVSDNATMTYQTSPIKRTRLEGLDGTRVFGEVSVSSVGSSILVENQVLNGIKIPFIAVPQSVNLTSAKIIEFLADLRRFYGLATATDFPVVVTHSIPTLPNCKGVGWVSIDPVGEGLTYSTPTDSSADRFREVFAGVNSSGAHFQLVAYV
jgi:hypothetical protein